MKQATIILMSILMLMTAACQASEAQNKDQAGQKVALETEKSKVSYSIGFNMGQNIRNFKEEIDLSTLVQGIYDATAGDDKAQMTQPQMMEVLKTFQQKAMQIQQEKRKLEGEKNLAEGKAFLEENAKKTGITTTKTGLQYQVITEGTGPLPQATDNVKVHYVGTLINGTEFDSSIKRGEPASFPLNRVIPAWTEGLQLMKVGSKYKFFTPANLAYGEQGRGPVIPPNAVLIFEVELLDIVKEEPAKTPDKPQPSQNPEPVKKADKN